ncbi:MAG: hypothetical protein NE328_20280 [Lentisphaeraceae bacterium]|nr:hypothetical protein [Lentisphaeraceae bacterium]
MKHIIYILLFFLVGCETKSVYKHHSPTQVETAAKKSQQIIENRKALLQNIPLLEKAKYFETHIFSKMHPIHRFTPKLYNHGIPGKLRMDMTALFLSSQVFKFIATKDKKTKSEILKILDSIYKADKSNGLDGFIPYKVQIQGNNLFTSSNETHINVYTQLLFAYIPILSFLDDQQIKQKVQRHMALIIDHLHKYNFTLVDHLRQEVKYSDLSPKFFSLQNNRKQLLLIFLDTALKFSILPDKYKELYEMRQNLSSDNYESEISNLHFKLLNLEFPTHSSSWLNLTNSFIGYHIDQKNYYKTAYLNLYKNYEDEENLLFMLMWKSISPDSQITFNSIESKLKEFPINPTNHEIINSQRLDLQILSSPPFTKLKRELEVEKALPFYQRPIRSFEWKLNQMRVDGNFTSTGNYQYTGIDYLTAYWMYRWLKNKSKPKQAPQ